MRGSQKQTQRYRHMGKQESAKTKGGLDKDIEREGEPNTNIEWKTSAKDKDEKNVVLKPHRDMGEWGPKLLYYIYYYLLVYHISIYFFLLQESYYALVYFNLLPVLHNLDVNFDPKTIYILLWNVLHSTIADNGCRNLFGSQNYCIALVVCLG